MRGFMPYRSYLLLAVVLAGGLFWYGGFPKGTESHGTYRGKQFWHPNRTQAVRTLVESPFARAQVSTRRCWVDS